MLILMDDTLGLHFDACMCHTGGMVKSLTRRLTVTVALCGALTVIGACERSPASSPGITTTVVSPPTPIPLPW